jgi:hypothetical protein
MCPKASSSSRAVAGKTIAWRVDEIVLFIKQGSSSDSGSLPAFFEAKATRVRQSELMSELLPTLLRPKKDDFGEAVLRAVGIIGAGDHVMDVMEIKHGRIIAISPAKGAYFVSGLSFSDARGSATASFFSLERAKAKTRIRNAATTNGSKP